LARPGDSALLYNAKETVKDAMEAEAKAEEQRYKQTADPKWLSQREELYEARTEAAYLGERSRLLETLEAFWTDVLLVQKNNQPAIFPSATFIHALWPPTCPPPTLWLVFTQSLGFANISVPPESTRLSLSNSASLKRCARIAPPKSLFSAGAIQRSSLSRPKPRPA